ncbi:hypothetical protein BWQ96_07847 [Gracilariopsis chorda]|uniref:Uncharacterized protein n=1 Tax=Gracilariopsis chorda TaxID=448386 RepID=A0A2V3IJY2_9FLOR|nr:hypothetical protein BWQ96_07847 [Gracilariopsis chorda]|eukprot:PXF42406.1 hypothetical protein BWQ96_07847 [Gracilariopsis chorda]
MPLNHGSSHPSATTTLIQRLKVIKNALHFLFKEEKDEETAFAVAFWNQTVSQSVLYFQDSSTYRGSFPGKQPKIEKNHDQMHHFYMMKYFWPRDIARPGCDAKGPQQSESS